MLKNLKSDLKKMRDPKKAALLMRFFKTKKGEYAEGDKFLGVMVPKSRALVKKYWQDLSMNDIGSLIKSPWHEERLIGLLILVKRFEFAVSNSGDSDKIRKLGSAAKIFNYYLSKTKYINNWDLVDLTAPKIMGAYLRNRNKDILLKLAASKNLWERRIAVLATFDFIYNKNHEWTLKICRLLLDDSHNLIHKACGWMLREAGKRCGEKILVDFLNQNAKQMPRVMLRYSIERLPKPLRRHYLSL